MRYRSTRGGAPTVSFDTALLSGVAPDGGLYLPLELPRFSADELATWQGLSYADVAQRIFAPFVGEALDAEALATVCARAWQSFRDPAIAPLHRLEPDTWLLELFHGPTLAFKDYALQPLGQLLEQLLARRDERAVLLGATSGDTGSAAIAAAMHCARAQTFILHPKGRITQVQRRQMTTVLADNVHNIAIDGNFDDCQSLAKALFATPPKLPPGYRMVAANSINWARIMGQIVYYFTTALALDAWHPDSGGWCCAVPTGNFGNAYAAWLAQRMGLPLRRLVVATNANDVIHRLLRDNRYRRGERALTTLSPSMDIAAASNVERLIYDLCDANGARVAELMARFARGEALALAPDARERMQAVFASVSVSDEDTCRTMRAAHERAGYRLDPHSAVGLCAGRSWRAESRSRKDAAAPLVVAATAHPAKFAEASARAGLPALAPASWPAPLRGISEREERCAELPAELSVLSDYIQARL